MSDRNQRQRDVGVFVAKAFGVASVACVPQRGLRFLEEATETAQAAGVPREIALQLVDFVYGRPVGELGQELGGVGVTLLALAYAAGLSADDCEAAEFARVQSKPLSHWAARNQAKNEAGFDLTKGDAS